MPISFRSGAEQKKSRALMERTLKKHSSAKKEHQRTGKIHGGSIEKVGKSTGRAIGRNGFWRKINVAVLYIQSSRIV